MNTNPAVVKIFATYQGADYDNPWQNQLLSTGTGSGVVIEGGYILTAAHVIANWTFIQVQETSQPQKRVAQVAFVCHECDLALLEVDDASFLEGITPAQLGKLPTFRDKVSVVGFPIGGDEISITEGVVSRIEVQQYSHSQRSLLAVTVDAAINSGNSGGPVFMDGRIVGIAFQSLSDGENIGEIVPVPIIEHFLERFRRGCEGAFPALGVSTQHLENPRLREHLGMAPTDSGLLVRKVHFNNSAWGYLEERDVLLAIDGTSIANNGTVHYRDSYRTSFEVILHEHFVGETLGLTVLRQGQRVSIEVPLTSLFRLIPLDRYDTTPTYFVYAGLVFQPLSRDYLKTWSKWTQRAPKEFLYLYYYGVPTQERTQVVCLTQILADEVNVGYERFQNEVVRLVDDTLVRDIEHLVELLEGAQDVVELTTSNARRLVFDPRAAHAARERILSRYRIPHDRSRDLQPHPEPPITTASAG